MWGTNARFSAFTFSNCSSSFFNIPACLLAFPSIQMSRGRVSVGPGTIRLNFTRKGFAAGMYVFNSFITFFALPYHGGTKVRWRFLGAINRTGKSRWFCCHRAIDRFNVPGNVVARKMRCFMSIVLYQYSTKIKAWPRFSQSFLTKQKFL